MISIIDLVLSLLGSLLTTLLKNKVPGEIVADVEAAVAKLQSVQGTLVTYQQFESLRVTPEW